MHLLFARGLGHIVIIPIGGLLAMTWAHLGFTWMVAVDVAAVMLLEMALVGGPVALAVGLKSIVPAVIGAIILPRFLLQPTITATIVSAVVVAATVVGVAWYLIRVNRLRMLRRYGDWNRTLASLSCLTLAAVIEVSVAGLALTMGGWSVTHVAAAFLPAPLWAAAYILQTSPRQRGSRFSDQPRPRWWPRRRVAWPLSNDLSKLGDLCRHFISPVRVVCRHAQRDFVVAADDRDPHLRTPAVPSSSDRVHGHGGLPAVVAGGRFLGQEATEPIGHVRDHLIRVRDKASDSVLAGGVH